MPSRRRPWVAARGAALRRAAVPLLVAALLAAELWWILSNGFGWGQPAVASSGAGNPQESSVATATPGGHAVFSLATPSPTAAGFLPAPSVTATPVAGAASATPSMAAVSVAGVTPTVLPSRSTTPSVAPSTTPSPIPSPARSPTPTRATVATPSPSPTTIPPSPTPSPAPAAQDPVLDQTVMGIFRGLPSGASAVFWNLSGPGKAEMNATTQVPSASTIKLPLMIEVLRQAEQGRISLTQQHTITADMVVGGTGILQGQVGRTLTTQQVLETTITYSDNVGANLLLDVAGMENVNSTMQQLGFASTHFARRLMDVEAQRRGLENMTSARDLAEMLRRIYLGQLISPSASAEMMRILRLRGQQTGAALDSLGTRLSPRPDIAHISGNLVGVHNDAGIIQNGGHAYLLSIFLHDQKDDSAAQEAIGDASARIFSAVMDSPTP